jgi:phenylacetate-CoA ligase
LAPEQAEVIERAFGGKVYRDYGGSEAMHVGFECREQRGYHTDLARFHVEILKDGQPARPGEAGDIVVTAFRNAAIPLVRYRIGDIGRWAADDTPCPCGNRFPLLAEVLGRAADVAVTAGGHLINLNLLGGIFRYAQEHIAQYQLVQKELDRFDVRWVARHERAIDSLPALQQELAAMFGGSVRFDWHQVPEILPERSGKHRALVPLKATDYLVREAERRARPNPLADDKHALSQSSYWRSTHFVVFFGVRACVSGIRYSRRRSQHHSDEGYPCVGSSRR